MKQLFFLILPTLLIIFTNSLAKKITVITQVVDGYPVLSPDGINITFPHIYEKELAEEIPRNQDVINTWFAWTHVADTATLSFSKKNSNDKCCFHAC